MAREVTAETWGELVKTVKADASFEQDLRPVITVRAGRVLVAENGAQPRQECWAAKSEFTAKVHEKEALGQCNACGLRFCQECAADWFEVSPSGHYLCTYSCDLLRPTRPPEQHIARNPKPKLTMRRKNKFEHRHGIRRTMRHRARKRA